MSGNDFLNKNVLRWHWKVDRDVAEVISSGSWFHVWGPETENARLPIVDSLTAGTVRRLVTAERKARGPARSATRTNGPRYRGAIPFMTLYVSRAILYSMRSGIRSQWRQTNQAIVYRQFLFCTHEYYVLISHNIPDRLDSHDTTVSRPISYNTVGSELSVHNNSRVTTTSCCNGLVSRLWALMLMSC